MHSHSASHLLPYSISHKVPDGIESNEQFVIFPNAKLVVFLNSFGVAAGSAMITARHNLSDSEAMSGNQSEYARKLTGH